MKNAKQKFILKDLSEYSRNSMVTTTVYIPRDQFEFLKKNDINLSHLIRDVIQEFLNESNKKKDGSE